MDMILFFIISFLASVVGAICGIGGGIIIKPVLDLLRLENVTTISFLSGCTVLSMSCYSVCKSLMAGEQRVDKHIGTPLAIGAAAGGLFGKELFTYIKGLFKNQNAVGSVQAICLALITLGTLVYTLEKRKIRTHTVENPVACVGIGMTLGVMSSFLGIGGGPINLVVLFFFFSMDTKTAAANSLYLILFSQLASLLSTLITREVPPFQWQTLVLMVSGGIGGGIAGRLLNRQMSEKTVEKLFVSLMIVLIGVSIFNAWR